MDTLYKIYYLHKRVKKGIIFSQGLVDRQPFGSRGIDWGRGVIGDGEKNTVELYGDHS